jgi:hypothetical protein
MGNGGWRIIKQPEMVQSDMSGLQGFVAGRAILAT